MMKTEAKPFPFIPLRTSSHAIAMTVEQEEQARKKSEIDAAEKRGYERGLQEGLARGTEQGRGERLAVEQQLGASLGMMAKELGVFLAAIETFKQQKAREMTTLAANVAQKVARNALKEDPVAVVEAVIKQSVAMVLDEEKIQISVHASLAPVLQEKLLALLKEQGYEGKVAIVGVESIGVADCKIEWAHGGIASSSERLCQKINQLLGVQTLPEAAAVAEKNPPPSEEK